MSTRTQSRIAALLATASIVWPGAAQIADGPGDRFERAPRDVIPSTPRQAPRVVTPDGRTAFVAHATGLLTLDIVDPTRPRVIGRAELRTPAECLALVGDLLVVTDGTVNVRIFAVSRSRAPLAVGVVQTLAPPTAVASSGSLALFAEGSAGLEIIDLVVPGAPVRVSVLRLGDRVTGVEMRDGLAAVTYAVGAATSAAMVSIAEPSHPRVVSPPGAAPRESGVSMRPRRPPTPAGGFDGGGAGASASMIRRVRWDDGVWATNFDVRFDRADTTIGPDGKLVAAGVPRFGTPRLLCPAPSPIGRRTSDVRVTRVWSGRWQDLTDCLVESWTNDDWSVQTVGISTDGLHPSDPSRVKAMGTPGAPNLFFEDALDPDPGWKHAPVSFMVADGCVLAFCVALDATDSDRQKSLSVCYWDENIAGEGHGERKWKLHGQRGPEAQPGHPRGAGWMSSGPWVPPGGADVATGKLLQFFVAFTDYRANPGSWGGQLFLMRCHRPGPDQKWTLDPVILLYADEPGGELVPIPGQSTFMHFHSAAVTFPGGGEDGRGMVVTLSVGDGWPNNRLVNISRDDFETYDDCTDSSEGARARTPTPGRIPPDAPEWNGWTTNEDRAGQRARVAFGKDENHLFTAQYLDTPHQIRSVTVPDAFGGYDQPSGVTPVYITGGGPAVYGVGSSGIIGKLDDQALLLNRRIASSSPTPVSGAVWSDSSIQPVCMVPTASSRTFLASGDEHSEWMYRISISDPARPIAIRPIAGIPTHAASGYNGAGVCLNWVCLFVGFRPAASSPSSAVSEYLALVAPSSIGSWAVEAAAQTLYYSPDGVHWGELFATNYTEFDHAMQSAFFRQREGETLIDRIFIGRDDWCGLWAVDAPTPATTVLARPIRISAGGANALRMPCVSSGAGSVDILEGPQGENVCFPVNISSFGARGPYAEVPAPPCEGPVMRCQFVDSHRMGTWRIGADVNASAPPGAKARVWMYRMPASTSGHPNEFPVNASAKVSFFASVRPTGEPVPESALLQGPLIGGSGSLRELSEGASVCSGWVPFTFEVAPGGSCGSGPYALQVTVVSSNNAFNRQDVLVALDFVGYANAEGTVELPSRPMKTGPGSSCDERLELRFQPPRPVSDAEPASTPWTMLAALTFASDGPDVKTLHRDPSPGALTLFTLWASPASYLRVCMDRERGQFRLVDHLGHAWEFGGPAEGDDGIPFAQPFMALRGRQMLIGLARFDAGGGASGYRAWVSIGGTRITYGTTLALAGVQPNRIQLGDQNQQHTDPADYFGFYFDEGHDMNEGEGRTMLGTLDFLK